MKICPKTFCPKWRFLKWAHGGQEVDDVVPGERQVQQQDDARQQSEDRVPGADFNN
jgi:hypothetical protein